MVSMKLKRLKIDQYRNVAPGTELVFNDTWNVLLGQNGTGKTTLLNLIAMVVASDFSPLKEEVFAIEYELSFTGGSSIAVRLQNVREESTEGRPRDATEINATIPRPKADSLSWLCHIKICLGGSLHSWEISSDPISAKITTQDGASSPKPIPIISPFTSGFLASALFAAPLQAIHELTKTRGQILIANNIANRNACRFDEGLTIFNAITGSQAPGSRDAIRPSSIEITFPASNLPSAIPDAYPFIATGIFPNEVVIDVIDSIQPNMKRPHAKPEFLRKAQTVLGFTNIELTWNLLQKEVSLTSERHTFGNFGFQLTSDDGSIINHALLSYGQKRLLAFFYYLAANRDIAVADELVNGLHYDWIEICLKEIGDRQSFLTSQNPLLLDFIPFTSAEEVQRSFLLCRREKRDGKNLMVWSNLDEESARSFFRAYETEAQQVSEILRSKGLW
jgi:energy-coupling factor transporter ATP-binding protein EcfA2